MARRRGCPVYQTGIVHQTANLRRTAMQHSGFDSRLGFQWTLDFHLGSDFGRLLNPSDLATDLLVTRQVWSIQSRWQRVGCTDVPAIRLVQAMALSTDSFLAGCRRRPDCWSRPGRIRSLQILVERCCRDRSHRFLFPVHFRLACCLDFGHRWIPLPADYPRAGRPRMDCLRSYQVNRSCFGHCAILRLPVSRCHQIFEQYLRRCSHRRDCCRRVRHSAVPSASFDARNLRDDLQIRLLVRLGPSTRLTVADRHVGRPQNICLCCRRVEPKRSGRVA